VAGWLIRKLNDFYFAGETLCFHHKTIAFGECLSRHGINVQNLRLSHVIDEGSNSAEQKEECHQATARFAALKQEQLSLWRVADGISGGSTLSDIKSVVSEGFEDIKASKDRDGKPLLHVAAVHNRLDVIDWLLSDHDAALSERDADGRTALQLSRAAGATQCEQRLRGLTAKDTVSQFVSVNYHRRRILKVARVAHSTRMRAVGLIQRDVRRYLVYRVYGPYIRQACYARERFVGIWSSVMECLKSANPAGDTFTWSDEKFKYDMMVESMASSEDDNVSDGDANDHYLGSSKDSLSGDIDGEKQLLNELTLQTVASAEHTVCEEDSSSTGVNSHLTMHPVDGGTECARARRVTSSDTRPTHSVELAHGVWKWLEQADANYREMFASRISRLAHGDSTYALAKHLHTTSYRVYEAKLDAGQRILWTKILRESTPTILVSYPTLYLTYIYAMFLTKLYFIICRCGV
jgi:hypothetical protein